MEKLRIGIIGAGSISHFHMVGYQANSDIAEVTAVCDLNLERAQDFAKKYNVPHVYGSYDEMLRDAPIDAVSVTTWNNAHAPATIAALKAGKHVLCEKPLAMNAREAQQMEDTAKEAGRLLMVGFVRRFAQNTDALKAVIDGGDLGEIYSSKVSVIRRWGNPGGWFSDKKRSGGGALIDLGVHIIDLARYLAGNPRPVSVYAATFSKLGMKPDITGVEKYKTADYDEYCDVEDAATALIRFDNGMVTYLNVTWVENAEDSSLMHFSGSKGGAQLEPVLEIYQDRHHYLTTTRPKLQYQGLDMNDIFTKEIRHFVTCARDGTPCLCPAEDGVWLMKILDAIYESAKTGHEVQIG